MNSRKNLSCFILAACALNAANLMAQQDSTTSVGLNEVVVTATKFPKNQSDTGKTLIVVDQEQLEKSYGKDISQVLNEQAGVIINGANSNPGKDKSVFVRGGKTAYTLILIDGIPVTDASGAGGAFDLRLISIDQVERIEILKGSQSTLYGTDAVAGVINIITKKGGERKIGGTANVSYGSFNMFKVGAGIQGTTELIDYNISYARLKTDGISEAKEPDDNDTFDEDGATQNAFQASIAVKPTSTLSLRPYVRINDFEGKYDGGSFTDDELAKYTSKLVDFGFDGQYLFKGGTANAFYKRNQTERSFTDFYGSTDYEGTYDHFEVFSNLTFAKKGQVLAGASRQNFNTKPGGVEEKKVDLTNVYLSLFANDIAGFSTEVGGRYVNHSTFGKVFTYSINPSYLLKRQLKIFAQYATGFKAPTINDLYGPFGANPDLKPEESKSLEGGVHFYSPQRKFDIRVTLFSRKVENAIVYTTSLINLDNQDDNGFELEPAFRAGKFDVRAFYTLIDGEVTTNNGVRDTTYNNLIRRPKHSMGFSVGYQATSNFFISANVQYFGKRSDLFFNMQTFESEKVEMSSYTLIDLYAEYKFLSHAKIFACLKNLLDEDYMETYGYGTLPINIQAGLHISF